MWVEFTFKNLLKLLILASHVSHVLASIDIKESENYKRQEEGSGLVLDQVERSEETLSEKLCTFIIIHLDRQGNQWNDGQKENSTDSDPNTDPGLYNGF